MLRVLSAYSRRTAPPQQAAPVFVRHPPVKVMLLTALTPVPWSILNGEAPMSTVSAALGLMPLSFVHFPRLRSDLP
jgi:hypothetical protein